MAVPSRWTSLGTTLLLRAFLISQLSEHLGFILNASARPRELLTSSKPAYAFIITGDSNADHGRALELTHGLIPSPEYYYKGAHTNGPNWVDYIVQALQRKGYPVSVFNYALGGTLACGWPGSDSTYSMPNQTQEAAVDWQHGKLPKGARRVFIDWSGSNDVAELFLTLQRLPTSEELQYVAGQVIACRAEAAYKLAEVGAAHDLVLLPVGPDYLAPAVPDEARDAYHQTIDAVDLAAAYGAAVLQAAFDNATSDSPIFGSNVVMLGSNADLMKGALSLNFTRLSSMCLQELQEPSLENPKGSYKVCPDPEASLFWDFIHYNTRFHQWLAQDFIIPRLQQMHMLPAVL